MVRILECSNTDRKEQLKKAAWQLQFTLNSLLLRLKGRAEEEEKEESRKVWKLG